MIEPPPDDVPTISDWVPVERRWFGFDLRSLPYALTALAIVVVLMIGLPGLNRATDWDAPVRHGDVILMGRGVTFAPPVGWEREGAVLESDTPITGVPNDASATLAGSGLVVGIDSAKFDGAPERLLKRRVEEIATQDGTKGARLTGTADPISVDGGAVGMRQSFVSEGSVGTVAALVLPKSGDEPATGITFVAVGPQSQLAAASDDLQRMFESVVRKERS